ncbi:nitrilase family protein [Paralimibaculum aggregatum]|uniref:Nitrilase family protein n=1 Tax=Paralimibaculum aggregatum TaxID=3036245 RepID=A0ABQ6LQ84_9RHOB|nr:nitrilase family protein [Limibaculum sp. NKW23]GMG82645.1 nitrilase family protein [Limibaculum sp. NKW23]
MSTDAPGGEAEITVSCLQFEPRIGDLAANRAAGLELIEAVAEAGARLAVLPELSDSGYVFESRAEAFALSGTAAESETIAGWAEAARRHDLHIVGGFCERDGGRLFNSAALVGPDGLIGVYRKTHLWDAENLWFEPGDHGYPVFATPLGRIGALICYDGWFPEAWRLLAMQGADIVCVPTNWVPMPSQPASLPSMSNILCMAAAHSNSFCVAAACRIGTERGQPFIGQSLIVNHEGWPVAGPAPEERPEVLTARVNLADARRKRRLNDFNQLLRDRRTDLYDEMLGTDLTPGWY